MTASTPSDHPPPAWPNGAPTVGQTAARSRRILPSDIERFTAISGDRNPLHYDAEVAGATPLGGIVVQGGVITAILNAVVAEDLPGPGSVFLQTDLRLRRGPATPSPGPSRCVRFGWTSRSCVST